MIGAKMHASTMIPSNEKELLNGTDILEENFTPNSPYNPINKYSPIIKTRKV
jgi:hypothetical protein